MPALPNPAIARPMINVAEDGAKPLIIEPISKTNIERRYDHLTLKRVKTRPKTGWKAHAVRRYDEPYQPMSAVDLNSAVIKGMAYIPR